MLDRVAFKNFKSLEDVSLELSPLTVLVGPNGSGKSSVLLGVWLLSRVGIEQPGEHASWDRIDMVFRERLAPRRLATSLGACVELSMRDQDGDTLVLALHTTSRYELTVTGPSGLHDASWPTDDANGHRERLDHGRIRHFSSVARLHLDATSMAETSTTEEEEPRMAADGAGLASTLAWLAGAKPDLLKRIATELARIVPGVRRILVHRERITDQVMDKVTIDGQPVWRPVQRTQLGDRFSLEFDNGTEVPADLLSEGTVLALGLLTKLHEPERPRVLLLDDIDRGLHIGAQAKLVAVLRDLMQHDPELQIVCTTHSAYLLDLFEPAEVRVLDLDASRATHAKPLTAHPEFEKWRFGTQTGELWAALGDAWVTAPSEDGVP